MADYWIVEPVATTVEVWKFAEGVEEPLIVSDRLPVRVRGSLVGEIDLSRVFG